MEANPVGRGEKSQGLVNRKLTKILPCAEIPLKCSKHFLLSARHRLYIFEAYLSSWKFESWCKICSLFQLYHNSAVVWTNDSLVFS